MTSSYAPWEKSTPAIERPFRSYGECFFGKDTAMTTCWGASMVAQLLYPGENAMAAGLSCTMSAYLAVVAGKTLLKRARPDPDAVGLAPRTAAGLAARSRFCLLYTSPSPRDKRQSRMPSSA